MINKEKTLSEKVIFKGRIVRLEHLDVEVDGKKAKREIVRHAQGVAVLAAIEDRFIFLEQFRKPFEGPVLEIPAGKVDEGEDAETAAMRELREETGYRAERLTFLCDYLSSPGFTDEVVHLYYAEGLTEDPLPCDEDESFNTYHYTKKEVLDLIEEGRLTDGKSLTAFLLWIQKNHGR